MGKCFGEDSIMLKLGGMPMSEPQDESALRLLDELFRRASAEVRIILTQRRRIGSSRIEI